MRKNENWGIILFWATLISPMISFSLAALIGEADIFGVAGIIRYSWIMWLFIPVGVLSILIGMELKKNSQNYKKNLIIALVCLPLIIIFGSYRFIFNSVSYDVEKVDAIEEKTKLELPDQIKIATNEFDSYDISYVKIIDEKSKQDFEMELRSNTLWQNRLDRQFLGLLPVNIQIEVGSFDYFVFYNLTNDEYNTYPSNNECNYVFIAYDNETQRLIILDSIT